MSLRRSWSRFLGNGCYKDFAPAELCFDPGPGRLDKHLAVGEELPLIQVLKEMTLGKPGWLISTRYRNLGFSTADDLCLAVDLRARSEGILMTCNAP
jgi:hypothetical protein